ncbi:MAG: bile acid:sodium symporter, partial [Planctomycetaceae bacterium]|nr:bile acid:sodium symporter [Planctomycetaceae bacterium]
MLRFFLRHWFLVCLTLLLFGGAALGQAAPELSQFITGSFRSGPLVFVILFGMSLTLPTESLRSSFLRPTGTLLAMLVNTVLLPLLTWGVVLLIPCGPFGAGFLMMAAVPTTMASAAVWTRKAGGNDAIPLLNT